MPSRIKHTTAPGPRKRASGRARALARCYRHLFESMNEGFALVEAIRDEAGHLVDYTILEINPALQRMLGVGPEVVGHRLMENPNSDPRWLRACDTALREGAAIGFDFHNPQTGRSHEIRLNPVGESHIAQFFFDITEREEAKRRQAELFDELNHRVKNNLALVSALLGLQARNAPEGGGRNRLIGAQRRVQSIADLHGRLYKDVHNDRIAFDAYLKDLCGGIAAAVLEGDRVTIEVVAEPAELDVDRAMPLGMVVNELVTNAAKYAYPPPRTGIVAVRFAKQDAGFVLTIADDGIGLPVEGGEGDGIGMKLVQSLVEQAGATLIVEPSPGARFTITAPA